MVRGVRGATTVEFDSSESILDATKTLLSEMISINDIYLEDVVSIIFTTTQDLTSQFPAKAARELGWNLIPLLGAVEADIEGSLDKCIRVLMHINTDLSQKDIHHIYLNRAQVLRPDLNSRG